MARLEYRVHIFDREALKKPSESHARILDVEPKIDKRKMYPSSRYIVISVQNGVNYNWKIFLLLLNNFSV